MPGNHGGTGTEYGNLIAEFRVSHPNLPLMETIEEMPDLQIDSQFQPRTSSGPPEMDFIIEGADFDDLERAASEDSSIERWHVINATQSYRTYRVRFTTETKLISPGLLDRGIRIDSIETAGNKWFFRVFAKNRETMLAALGYCREECAYFALDRLYGTVSASQGRDIELTPIQKETIETAYAEGYFEVPRQTSLEALGRQLGVSDSAVSERIRKAINSLVEQTLSLEV